MKKYDSIILGLAVAVLVPALAFTCAYLFHYKSIPIYRLSGFGAFIIASGSKVLSLCAIANLLPFYLFLQTERMKSVRGVVLGTLGVGVLVFFLFILC